MYFEVGQILQESFAIYPDIIPTLTIYTQGVTFYCNNCTKITAYLFTTHLFTAQCTLDIIPTLTICTQRVTQLQRSGKQFCCF